MKNLRKYGEAPYTVALLHGGPGAPGEMAPVARELSEAGWGVLEPRQTADSVDGQVAELRNVIETEGALPLIVVGFSWGAWLGFILAARYPGLVEKLILVSSGPFEADYAGGITAARMDRLSEAERLEVISLTDIVYGPDSNVKDAAMSRIGALFARADAFDPLPREDGDEPLGFSYHIYESVRAEADALRRSGALLDMGKNITCPVTAIHGDYDCHPAEGVREPLSPIIRDFRFVLLEKCGHEPWLEKYARDEFYKVLKNELK